jgi:hypothetical protein
LTRERPAGRRCGAAAAASAAGMDARCCPCPTSRTPWTCFPPPLLALTRCNASWPLPVPPRQLPYHAVR